MGETNQSRYLMRIENSNFLEFSRKPYCGYSSIFNIRIISKLFILCLKVLTIDYLKVLFTAGPFHWLYLKVLSIDCICWSSQLAVSEGPVNWLSGPLLTVWKFSLLTVSADPFNWLYLKVLSINCIWWSSQLTVSEGPVNGLFEVLSMDCLKVRSIDCICRSSQLAGSEGFFNWLYLKVLSNFDSVSCSISHAKHWAKYGQT